MRAIRLAPVLLALAACSVETNSLKPKTDAECAAKDATTKACGYRCVPTDDPATGCGTPGDCSPCPGDPAHHVVAACAAGACFQLCAAGWGSCNLDPADGCERRVDGDDASNCGACGRTCGTCSSGSCSGTPLGAGFSRPRGIVKSDGGSLYFVDAGIDGGALVDSFVTPIATMLGDARWAADASSAGQSRLLVSGTVPSGSGFGYRLAITEVPDPGSFAATNTIVVGDPVAATDHIDGLAAAGASLEYFFTTSQADMVYAWDGARSQRFETVSGVLGAKGLATFGGRVYLGTDTPDSGQVWWVEPTGTRYNVGQVAAGVGRPTRLAVFADLAYFGGQPVVFWISGDDGGVRATLANGTSGTVTLFAPDPAHPRSQDVDIFADADGVYWSDAATGEVFMWRAVDDRVLPVGYSPAPFSVAATSLHVYWSDTTWNTVLWAEKPALQLP